MSEPKEKTTKKNVQGKWTKAQAIGFWVLIGSMILFWGGVAIGSYAMQNSINEKEALKTQAVESYKAELLKESQ